MIRIYSHTGKPIRHARNLRGITDHVRRVGLILAVAYPVEQERGDLLVFFGDGATCHADFASYTVLCRWLQARRSWAGSRSLNGAKPF